MISWGYGELYDEERIIGPGFLSIECSWRDHKPNRIRADDSELIPQDRQ